MRRCLALQERLGDKAEVFAGSWLAVGEADGIARSGDPVANRRGVSSCLAFEQDLDDLVQRVELNLIVWLCSVTIIWAQDEEKAVSFSRYCASRCSVAWQDASVQASNGGDWCPCLG